jgi:hypothetical protein
VVVGLSQGAIHLNTPYVTFAPKYIPPNHTLPVQYVFFERKIKTRRKHPQNQKIFPQQDNDEDCTAAALPH